VTPASSHPGVSALRRLRHSAFARRFLGSDPFARFWLLDLRAHAALALIMTRASAAALAPAALTRRGISDLSALSVSAVHTLLAEACARGDFQRDTDSGDRRRVMLMPCPATTDAHAALVADFLLAATDGALPAAAAAAAARDPQVMARYARFAAALVAVRRPGGRLWLRSPSLAMLGDILVAEPRAPLRLEALHALARRRGMAAAVVEEEVALATMSGLVERTADLRLRMAPEGRAGLLDLIEAWRVWSLEARLALGGPGAAPASAVA
jgi:hypothetical protein